MGAWAGNRPFYPDPIGPVFDRLKQRLSFLGSPRVVQKNRNNTLIFSFESEIPPVIRLKLKVEINCREKTALFGIVNKPFTVASPWYSGSAEIATYTLEELLGSKTRALYQRRKGRDLFDLWYAMTTANPSPRKIVDSFSAMMQSNGLRVTRGEFMKNMTAKMADDGFKNDMSGLLRPGIAYTIDEAWKLVARDIIGLLP